MTNVQVIKNRMLFAFQKDRFIHYRHTIASPTRMSGQREASQ
jgi:hypothetical protein